MPRWPLRTHRALVAGWFSLDHQGATAGDLRAAEIVRGWLLEAGVRCEVALGKPFRGGVRWDQVRPSRYDSVFVVCGPVAPGMPLEELVERFSGRRLVGINLSVLQPLEIWNPWSTLLPRDGVGVDTFPSTRYLQNRNKRVFGREQHKPDIIFFQHRIPSRLDFDDSSICFQ